MFLRKQNPPVALQPNPQRPQSRQLEPRLVPAHVAPVPAPPPAAPPPVVERANPGRTLAVGRGISLSGTISSCETLLVEGEVEATSFEGRTLDIAAGATFKGNAKVEVARIAGSFSGELLARERLVLAASGRANGQIRYSKLEISPGGEIAGDIALLPPGE
jgi:cytoskeletal protein CcmA (bactofilin family)